MNRLLPFFGPKIPVLSCFFLGLACSFGHHAEGQYTGRYAPEGMWWRADAAAMIDQNRKADIDIKVELPDGTAVSNASVHVEMKRHAFKFGTAVDARTFLPGQSLYNATYAEKIPELFNTVVFENHMKWKAPEGDFGRGFEASVTDQGLQWLADRDLNIRGHTMLWTGYDKLPSRIQTMLDNIDQNPTQQNKQELYDATFERIEDIAELADGRIYAWDALNEPRVNQAIDNALVGFTPAGESTITSRGDIRARWFNAAKAADPNAQMMVNDYQVIPGGGLADTEPADYMNQIDGILNNGGTLEGIGFQSHFEEVPWKTPTGLRDVWAVLDAFDEAYGLPMEITEFDFGTTDLSLQADYTRDFMTAVFAHPSVEAFVMWGFWEGRIFKEESALFDEDWNIKPNGQAYIDLVFGEWWTDEQGDVNDLGEFDLRGFLGEYEITVEHNGELYTFAETLDGNGLARTYTLAPEPAVGALGLSLIVFARRRRA